jgi:hypothetical protein
MKRITVLMLVFIALLGCERPTTAPPAPQPETYLSEDGGAYCRSRFIEGTYAKGTIECDFIGLVLSLVDYDQPLQPKVVFSFGPQHRDAFIVDIAFLGAFGDGDRNGPWFVPLANSRAVLRAKERGLWKILTGRFAITDSAYWRFGFVEPNGNFRVTDSGTLVALNLD